MKFIIEKIINFESNNSWKDNNPPFGFFDSKGNRYSMSYDEHWIGQYTKNGQLLWTAGAKKYSENHINLDFKNPHYITDTPENKILVSSSGNNKIYKIDPNKLEGKIFIDGTQFGMTEVGNCVFDGSNRLWINEITGCRLFLFDLNGNHLTTLGSGLPGFNLGTCEFNEANFNWIYDIRRGPDGNIYLVDSKNYAVRMIDIYKKKVITLAGNGTPGYTGDGDLAINATFGGNENEYFDGPWAISLDEEGNIYIGDTQNHVVRIIDAQTKQINTIAGDHNAIKGNRNSPNCTNPFELNLYKICSMDYYNGYLYIPEWDGDLIILKKMA